MMLSLSMFVAEEDDDNDGSDNHNENADQSGKRFRLNISAWISITFEQWNDVIADYVMVFNLSSVFLRN